MRRSTAALLGAGLLLSGTTALPAASATAPGPVPTSADPARTARTAQLDPVDALPEGQLEALRRDLDLTTDQVRERLLLETSAQLVEAELTTELGDTYGGTWISADGDEIVVGVTDRADAAAVRAAGASPELVTHSLDELEVAKETLDDAADETAAQVHAWFVDVSTNTVVVQASSTAAALELAADAGLEPNAVRAEVLEEGYELHRDVRGGDEYVINGTTLCSVGFAVHGGFVTAGHCGSAGSPTRAEGVDQGVFQASTFPGNDYAWVRTHSAWTPRPVVNDYRGGTVNVSGSVEAPQGASICRSGRTTGWRCGTITGKNTTVNYSGNLVYGMSTTNACSAGGDSGGAVLSGTQAQGVHSGGSGGCDSANPSGVFQPITPILERYNLRLVTTGTPIVGFTGRCVDVPGSDYSRGKQLQIHDCNGTNAQNWTFESDGTVRVNDMCMEVAWAWKHDGAPVQLMNCNGNPAQQFRLTSSLDLVNTNADKCVDVKDWAGTNGGKLQIWQCTGAENQKWWKG